MKRIEVASNISYNEVKQMAGALMVQNPLISSVRVLVEKETHKKWIEYTEFSQKTLDKIGLICYNNVKR